MRQRSGQPRGASVRIFQSATPANTGSEKSILKAIKVTASMW
jgi:hypothetical protein